MKGANLSFSRQYQVLTRLDKVAPRFIGATLAPHGLLRLEPPSPDEFFDDIAKAQRLLVRVETSALPANIAFQLAHDNKSAFSYAARAAGRQRSR